MRMLTRIQTLLNITSINLKEKQFKVREVWKLVSTFNHVYIWQGFVVLHNLK